MLLWDDATKEAAIIDPGNYNDYEEARNLINLSQLKN